MKDATTPTKGYVSRSSRPIARSSIHLDMLVESGSSAAFRMRDDFVTPISVQSADATRQLDFVILKYQ